MTTSPSLRTARFPPALGTLLRCLQGFIVQLTLGVAALAQAGPPPGGDPPGSREAEITLALSACPPAVANGAGVYVLSQSGYVNVRPSRNGFNALVQHTLPTAQEPRCMDAEGTRTWLPRILKVAELRAQGKSREEIQQIIAEALAKGVLQPPTRLGVDYMLSTQNRVPNARGEVTPFPPHVMFYAPYLTNADIGVDNAKLGADGNPMGPAFVAAEGTPYALIIVPVSAHDATLHTMAAFGSSDGLVEGDKNSTPAKQGSSYAHQQLTK